MFVETFDDENAKKGYCLYKVGCKGPSTYNACGIMKWNNGVSYPIQSGHGCFGCTEEKFWDNGPIYERIPAFKGFGIEATADQVGLVALGVTGAAIAAHAVATNIRKRKVVGDLIAEGKQAEKEL
jgi:hydrogenase small subunit